jgi:hypothetical protein
VTILFYGHWKKFICEQNQLTLGDKMRRKQWRWKFVDEFIRDIAECGETRLIVGIDPEPPDPYPNAVFYIRMVSQDLDTMKPCKTQTFWLSLSEMTRLSVLMSIASRFWMERLDKREEYTKERVRDFQNEYTQIKEALERLLPE